MKIKMTILAVIVILALFMALPAFAQSDTPTPESDATAVVEAPPDVTVVVEQPTEPAPTSTVQSFLTTGAIFAALGVLTFFMWQNGQNLKVVAKTVPLELAQLGFRVGMEKAAETAETYDDEAFKTLATALGYDVIPDGRGGYTIIASASVVAENQAIAKEAKK